MLSKVIQGVRYMRMRSTRPSGFQKVIMPLKAFFDGSGNYHEAEETVCVVGGFIALEEQWSALKPDWFAVLSCFEVTEFKASAPQSFDYEFKKWDEEKRRAFLQALVTVLKKHLTAPSKPIAALIPKSQFESLPEPQQQHWGGDPYFVCLQDILTSSAIHAHELYTSPEFAHIICDEENDEVRKIAERVYFSCKKGLPDKMGEHLASFGFGISHQVAGLQVADFVAYYALQLRRDMLEGNDNLIDKPWWPMEQLMAMFHPDFEYYIAPQLWEREPLKNYSLPD